MRITVIGAVAVIGAILLLAFIVDRLVQNSKGKQSGNDEQSTRPSEWLTASEAARYLRVKSRTVLLWARQGKIKGHVLSGTKRHAWRFRLRDLDATLLQPVVLSRETE